MFFRRKIIGLVVVGFLIFGVLGMVRSSAYQAGWSRGYYTGQMTAAEQSPATTTAPAAPQTRPSVYDGHSGYYGHGFSPFGWFIGGLFQLLIILFILNFIVKMLFWRRWRHHWHKHGKHGPWDGKRGGSCGHHHKHDHKHETQEKDERSDKERYYDEHGADGPIADM